MTQGPKVGGSANGAEGHGLRERETASQHFGGGKIVRGLPNATRNSNRGERQRPQRLAS